jgi:hypothetical protein
MILPPEQRLKQIYGSYAMGGGCAMDGGSPAEQSLRAEVDKLERLVAERERGTLAHYVIEHGDQPRTLCGSRVAGKPPGPRSQRCVVCLDLLLEVGG